MNLREKQDQFISDMAMFETWPDRFNYLISLSDQLPPKCPENLLKHKIEFCQSQTFFKAVCPTSPQSPNPLQISGWSNSPIIGGIIIAIATIFNLAEYEELETTEINFHTRSRLIENLTPIRQQSLLEMIRRIKGNLRPASTIPIFQ